MLRDFFGGILQQIRESAGEVNKVTLTAFVPAVVEVVATTTTTTSSSSNSGLNQERKLPEWPGGWKWMPLAILLVTILGRLNDLLER